VAWRLASAMVCSIRALSEAIISNAFCSASATAFCTSDMAWRFTSFTASSGREEQPQPPARGAGRASERQRDAAARSPWEPGFSGMPTGHAQQHRDGSRERRGRAQPHGIPSGIAQRSGALQKTLAGGGGSQMCTPWGGGSQMCTPWGGPAAGLLFLQSKSAASVFTSTEPAESLASKHSPAFFQISSVT